MNYIPLSPQRFSHLRWQRYSDYRHATHLHLVPVAAPELGPLVANLPLVFAQDPHQEHFALCALTGLSAHTNHCLDANHHWQLDYVPAFLRSHPFRLLPPPQGSKTQRVLAVDIDSPWVSEHAPEAFLDANQQMTPTVHEVFQFLGKLAQHFQRTGSAVAALQHAGLLTPWPLKDHHGQTIKGLMRMNETALNSIDAETLQTLRRTGALAVAYAQIYATHQLPRLQTLARQHTGAEPELDLARLLGTDEGLEFKF